MQEVTIRLKFTTACLGHINRNDGRNLYEMSRDPAGRVVFFASRWQQELTFAAQLASRADRLVQEIRWAMHIDGSVTRWKRYLADPRNKARGRRAYAMHEAFSPGSVIGVTAVLPAGLEISQFRQLLELVGIYKGISPFRHSSETYGLFDVVSVLPAKRVGVERDSHDSGGDDS